VRILVLNQYFYPDRSATSQLLTELCEDLAGRHEVIVVTGRPSYNAVASAASRGFISHERHGRVRIERVWSTRFDRSSMAGRLTNYATYVVGSVVAALRVSRPDVVVALTDPPPIGLVGLLAARVRRRPFVLVVKDIFPDVAVELGVVRGSWTIRGLRAMQRLLFGGAARLVSIGRDMDRRLLELGAVAERIATIHDWSDGNTVRPLQDNSFRREHGWDDRVVVMHSGNVGLSQDLDTVMEAARSLLDDPSILFAIVGEGASKARLRRLCAEGGITNVVFLPFQNKADLSESLGAADVHLVTLKHGLTGYIVPSKLYGILAVGKPYIAATDEWSEPATIAREEGCGLHLPPGDPEALAKAIRELAHDPELAAMGARGRRALEARFDRRLAHDAYERLFEEVVQET
jgi:colanic acid biosynthesis glycosyl transferase WcaI